VLLRAALRSPGGELPFGLEIHPGENPPRAFLLNGDERIPVPKIEFSARKLALRFPHYASEIKAVSAGDGSYAGTWRKRAAGGGWTVMGFSAEVLPRRLGDQGRPWRFAREVRAPRTPGGPAPAPFPDSIAGDWKVSFHGADGQEDQPAVARFRNKGGRILGTFLTPTGDYRYLEGLWDAGELRLSAFDGAHAFLFHARIGKDGRLTGDFWSRDTWHETWEASPLPPGTDLEDVLPDPLTLTGMKPGARFDFAFPDLDGRRVSLSNPRFQGKVVIVEIFGSWCPNCNDEAPVLADLYARFHPRGLEVVGLAYELTGDPALDAEQVRRYGERYGISWPLLLAGTSDKKMASRTLPSLTGILAFPTTLFLGRDGTVREIYTGFSGPATGEEFTKLRAHWEAALEKLLAEPAPAER